DSDGPSYNLRERLSNQFNERKAGKNDSDLKDESCGLVGSEFHAEAVPDCYGRVSLSIVREPEPQYFNDDFLHDFCISTLKSNSSEDFVSGEAVIDFVTEACSKSAFYLDVLELHGEQEIEKLGLFNLENWSEAKNLITRLRDMLPCILLYLLFVVVIYK
ncbi:unnamed protein product, partial [Brassica oleracea]